MSNHDEKIAQLAEAADIPPRQAQQLLEAADWDFASAMTAYYNPHEELSSDEGPDIKMPQSEDEQLAGGRRLGAGLAGTERIPAEAPGNPRKTAKKAAPKKKFATLGDFSNATPERDDSDDSHDDDNHQDMFAGGEKSGLAVKNPDDIKKKILDKARRTQPRPGGDDPPPAGNQFAGTGRTLGGEDTPSQTIPPRADPNAPRRVERVERTLHFWADGFSVDDGDLFSSSDPRNADILNGIRRGRAPLAIMNVQPGQEVDVEIQQHETNYVKPKPKYKPFMGRGNRLGNPTHASSDSQTAATPSAPPPAAPTSAAPTVDLDASQPVINLQIRLGDGTRLPSRFNPSHTIGEVYAFVAAASPASSAREWVLMTTMPNKELTDQEVKLGEVPDFKRGGMVVQRWK